MAEGMELLMIASGPLVGGAVGIIVDRYPAPYLDHDEDQDEEKSPVMPSLHPGIEVACTVAAAIAAFALPAPLSLFAAALGWVLLTWP